MSDDIRAAGFDPSRGLHILQHSLGVDQYGRGEQYRNHFATGPESIDHADCMGLVAAGLMNISLAPAYMAGMDLFHVTAEGKAYVAARSPAAPILTRGQQRYREWLNISDVTGESFIQFCRRRDSDGSGEAGETGTGSTEGDSAGPKDIAQSLSPIPTLIPITIRAVEPDYGETR